MPLPLKVRLFLAKTIILVVVCFCFSYGSSALAQIVMFADAQPPLAWYEQPAVVAAIATGIFFFGAKLFERYWGVKDNKDTRLHGFSERMEELTAQQWMEVIKKRDELHQQQVEFLRGQNRFLEIAKCEYREKHLAAMSEVTRLQAFLANFHRLMALRQIEFEPAPIRSYDEILVMADVDGKVARCVENLKQSLGSG